MHIYLSVDVFLFSIPLIAGVLTSFATACAFLSEHIIAFMTCKLFNKYFHSKIFSLFNLVLKKREESNGSTSNRILL